MFEHLLPFSPLLLDRQKSRQNRQEVLTTLSTRCTRRHAITSLANPFLSRADNWYAQSRESTGVGARVTWVAWLRAMRLNDLTLWADLVFLYVSFFSSIPHPSLNIISSPATMLLIYCHLVRNTYSWIKIF